MITQLLLKPRFESMLPLGVREITNVAPALAKVWTVASFRTIHSFLGKSEWCEMKLMSKPRFESWLQREATELRRRINGAAGRSIDDS
jgi:hypothetical protein